MKKLALLVLFAMPAWGQVTYYYIGAPLLLVTNSEHAPELLNVTGQIILGTPLAPNQANQAVTPISFYFLGPSTDLSTSFTATINGESNVQGQFSFDTENGVIIAWHINVTGQAPHNTDTVQVDSSTGDLYQDDFDGCGEYPCVYQSNTATPGVWTYGADVIVAMQKQLTHMTSEMEFYRQGVVTYEAEFLAWEAMAKKCQANAGHC